MKTAKEFIERLQNDEEFLKAVNGSITEKLQAGNNDYTDITVSVAAEFGYEVTHADIESMAKAYQNDLSDEELGKVSGGTWTAVMWSVFSVSMTVATVLVTTQSMDG